MKTGKEKITKNISNSIVVKIFRWVLTSTSFALLLAICFFLYEMINSAKEQKETVINLMKIEQSLSTRYLGIFPNYLTQIDELLANANPEKPVIIFEDVLYYGILSGPKDFKNVVYRLLDLANKGCKITIAYYDIDGMIFRRMIQEGRIKQQYLAKLDKERAEILTELRSKHKTVDGYQNFYRKADSITSEKYFVFTRNDPDFKKSIEKYLKPLYDNNDRDSLFYRIDEVKRKSLDKPILSVEFHDFMNMYRGMSQILIDIFTKHNMELIGLNEYLTMSCWMNNDKAIFAFPSKFNTDEIGFFTQDQVFSKYINTMLEGVKNLSDSKLTEKEVISTQTKRKIEKWKKGIIGKSRRLSANDFKKYPISDLWKTEFKLGYIGNNSQTMYITFESVYEISTDEYEVSGFSQVNSNICDFKGAFENIVFYESEKTDSDQYPDNQRNGFIVGDFVLKENETQNAAGIFRGTFITYWYINRNGEFLYDKIIDGNNQFYGEWQKYNESITKTIAWGDSKIPMNTD